MVPRPRGPGGARQAERLTPQFQALTDALAAERVDTSGTTNAPDPELVVVFDLAGTVTDFRRATQGVPGLEFLAEFEDDASPAEDDFHFVDKDGQAKSRDVPQTLYLVWTDARAAAQLVSLFTAWTNDETARFPQGLAPLKQAFAQLRAVRRWGAQDRVRETGLLDTWAEDLEVAGMSTTRVEVELWFRNDPGRRARAQAEVTRLIRDAGGQVVTASTLPGIDYDGLLADLPRNAVETVLAQGPGSIALLNAGDVMFVSPARPMSIPAVELTATSPSPAPESPLPAGPARVALLDGLPLANHLDLVGRVVVDDPDAYAERYTTSATQVHGTAMASLICRGDLNDPGRPLTTPLYCRPVMEPHPFFPDRETVTPDALLVDLVHRCFQRMLEGDSGRGPEAPGVRVVNLSIGDPARIFARRLSPLARLLDWLAYRFNLVILVSAGNHDSPLLDANLDADGHTLGTAHYQQARLRRLYSPAEAVNVVTVGALHADGAGDVGVPDTVIDATADGMPAIYGALGGGYRRSVKPDVLLPGGRQRYVRPVLADGETTKVRLRQAPQHSTGPGLRVAAPERGGALDATGYFCGTSGATALATNAVSTILDVLGELNAANPDAPDPQFHPVLAKTLLVHAAHWDRLPTVLTANGDLSPGTSRAALTHLLGYGPADPSRIATAALNRVVLIGAAAIHDKQRHTFSFPLPSALAASREWRRLTITLAWLSPTNPRSQAYRMARLGFGPPTTPLGVTRTEADPQAVRRGTVQHEVLEGSQAVAFVSGDALRIEVDCRLDGGQVAAGVRYGLAATIEVGANVAVDLHTPVQDVLVNQIRTRARQQTQG
jgi:hypothetical protein